VYVRTRARIVLSASASAESACAYARVCRVSSPPSKDAPGANAAVVLGMSGGVDSSLAGHLLAEHGYQVTGLFMKNWEEDDVDECSAAVDLADATRVAHGLGIELRTVNFATEYWDRVFTHFLAEYEAGRTPNPDVLCNREIKFKEFREHAWRLGAEYIATGHYARLDTVDGVRQLRRARDESKDQSYFLHALDQQALANVLFPLGELRKDAVRALAAERGVPVHDKRDSTGICFIGERPFRDFLSRFLKTEPGLIIDDKGHTVGEHRGASLYTIGQRNGLGIGGLADAVSGEPWYVYAKDVTSNTLRVVQGHNNPLLLSRSLTAIDANWISGEVPAQDFAATAKTRYRQTDSPCTVYPMEEGTFAVEFESPQRAVTPGQSVVLYHGDICLGGGIIASTARSGIGMTTGRLSA
jgi:tRNA-specific 2-thiouridylase